MAVKLGEESVLVTEGDGDGVVTVTLNRPDKRNAWTMELVDRLTHHLEVLARRDTVRVLVITGAGSAFSAGGDLNWMKTVMASDNAAQRRDAHRIMDLLERVDTFPAPVIARVNGAAFGGGFGLVCAADLAIGATDAKLGLPEVRLGILPGVISPFVLRRIGAAAVRAHCLSGAVIPSDLAHRLGLLHAVVPPDDLDSAVERAAREYLEASPEAVALAKRLFRALENSESPSDTAIDAILEAWRGADAREGVTAFLERRSPYWRTL